MAAPRIPTYVASTTGAIIGSSGSSSSSSYSSDSFLDYDRHGNDAYGSVDAYAVPHNLTSFLDRRPLAWRTGLPPSAGGVGLLDLHPKELSAVPTHSVHRGRRTRDSVERLRYDMNDFVKATVWANHDTVRLRPSMCCEQSQHHEEGGTTVKGIFVDCGPTGGPLPGWLQPTHGEHLHVHADGSAHMILSLADAATAIECGWAERLPLPLGAFTDEDDSHYGAVQYAAVHAPRCASELADWKRLVLASVRFCTYTSRDLCIRRPERL